MNPSVTTKLVVYIYVVYNISIGIHYRAVLYLGFVAQEELKKCI